MRVFTNLCLRKSSSHSWSVSECFPQKLVNSVLVNKLLLPSYLTPLNSYLSILRDLCSDARVYENLPLLLLLYLVLVLAELRGLATSTYCVIADAFEHDLLV
jgi:hypothetical protein